MTLGDLEAWVLNFLQTDYPSGNWSQVEIQQYLRDEEMRLFVHIDAKSEDFFQTSFLLSEVQGQSVYNLPTNFFKGIRVERVIGALATQNLPVPMNVVDKNFSQTQRARGSWWPSTSPGTAQIPMHYQLHGQSTIEFFPICSTSIANSINVIYAARPIGMFSQTDVPFQLVAGGGGPGKDDLREWHDILAMGACVRALEHEEAYPQADRLESQKERRIAELDAYLKQINKQAPRFVHVTDAAWEY